MFKYGIFCNRRNLVHDFSWYLNCKWVCTSCINARAKVDQSLQSQLHLLCRNIVFPVIPKVRLPIGPKMVLAFLSMLRYLTSVFHFRMSLYRLYTCYSYSWPLVEIIIISSVYQYEIFFVCSKFCMPTGPKSEADFFITLYVFNRFQWNFLQLTRGH